MDKPRENTEVEAEYLDPEHEVPQSPNEQQRAQSSGLGAAPSLPGEPSEIEKLKAQGGYVTADVLARALKASYSNTSPPSYATSTAPAPRTPTPPKRAPSPSCSGSGTLQALSAPILCPSSESSRSSSVRWHVRRRCCC